MDRSATIGVPGIDIGVQSIGVALKMLLLLTGAENNSVPSPPIMVGVRV